MGIPSPRLNNEASSLLVLCMSNKEDRLIRWYFGGLAAAGAACCTHPLDLIKVQMQTQEGKNISLSQVAKNIFKNQGILGFYNGISASVTRQLTYSTVRFAIYETIKQYLTTKDRKPLSFPALVALASLGGAAGGLVGNPADLVNVRMQNDLKLPPERKRNYKNVFEGIWRVAKFEGVKTLWVGASMNCCRSSLMTVGQLAFYDEFKALLLSTSYFQDNIYTHIGSSFGAGAVATTLTQPVDVIKTRVMNAGPEHQKNILKIIASTAKEGHLAFFKGFVPAFVRIAPHSILTFIFLEQLRLNFGIVNKNKTIYDI